jgi:hypothetical protein
MSGPKVVNVVALRRQQKRQGLAALRKLERVLAECARFEREFDSAALLERLHALREAEKWEDLSREAPRHLSFHRERLERLRQDHANEQAAKLRLAYRTGELAEIAAIEAAEAERAAEKTTAAAQELRVLATAYHDPDAAAEPTKLPAAFVDPFSQRLEKCWALLGSLSATEDSPVVQEMARKAANLRHEPAERRLLLLDSLVLEISSYLRNRRAMADARAELEAVLAELTELADTVDAAGWSDKIKVALAREREDPGSLIEIAREARARADAAFERETQRAQRDAVLRAIAAAGYEVREGMATAWAEDGRIVLRKPNDSQYGVELSAPSRGTAIQTRVVAFSESRDPRRDVEVEQTWCGEFQTAREELEADGFQSTLVQAQEAGTIPIKVVGSLEPRREIESPKERRL